jgi:hypothetical protein
MAEEEGAALVRAQVADLIRIIRGQRVMLDSDLAQLYSVETKGLLRAVRRHIARFPVDFAFQLTSEEFSNLRYQIGTSSSYGGRRYLPYAFTEQGVAMLSSVLNSPRAIEVNVEIMRAFVRLRTMLAANARLSRRLDELVSKYDRQFAAIFDALQDRAPTSAPRRRLGFQPRSGTGDT